MTNSAKLYQKFLAVQQQLKPLLKSGKNEFHRYTYTTASDVLEPVREACNANGLILYASVIDSRVEQGRAWVNVLLTCADPETGESIECNSAGYSEEWNSKENKPTGDKAIYKASTGAIKYAVRLMFCLPSEDDPEKSNSKPSSPASASNNALISDAQRKRLYALIRDAGLNNDEAKNFLSKWGYSSSTQILRQDYDAICNAIADSKRGGS
jgi:ERF superfamily